MSYFRVQRTVNGQINTVTMNAHQIANPSQSGMGQCNRGRG